MRPSSAQAFSTCIGLEESDKKTNLRLCEKFVRENEKVVEEDDMGVTLINLIWVCKI